MTIGFNHFKTQILKLGIQTNEDLATYVLEKHKVAMLPGIDFGFEKEDLFFRIAFVDFDGQKVMESYQQAKEIDIDFIKEHTPNIFEGVQKIKKFITAVSG
jgi:aspartate aminotransferase